MQSGESLVDRSLKSVLISGEYHTGGEGAKRFCSCSRKKFIVR